MPSVISETILLIGNCTRILDCSALVSLIDAEVCPWMTKASKISEAPILDPVPLVMRLDLNAFVTVLSLLAKYLFIPII